MSEPSQLPTSTLQQPAASLVATTARWWGVDDDLALGCESADPTLQIERWSQEVVPFPTSLP